MMKVHSRTVLAICLIALSPIRGLRQAHAQDNSNFRFQPPSPPPLDGENFDDDEDAIDMDENFRPPPPPLPNANENSDQYPSGSADNRPQPYTNPSGPTTSAKKFHFKVVDGDYWEKGKKRIRGAQTHVSNSDAAK